MASFKYFYNYSKRQTIFHISISNYNIKRYRKKRRREREKRIVKLLRSYKTKLWFHGQQLWNMVEEKESHLYRILIYSIIRLTCYIIKFVKNFIILHICSNLRQVLNISTHLGDLWFLTILFFFFYALYLLIDMQIVRILCQFLRKKLLNLLFIRKKRTLMIFITKEKFCKLVCRLYLRSYMYDALKMDKTFRMILIRLNEAINV